MGQNREEMDYRRRAEDFLKKNPVKAVPIEDHSALLHELQVHQIELEMQNQELRDAQQRLENSLQQYTQLFDLAPVGYLISDLDMRVANINLTLCDYLQIERLEILRNKFHKYIHPEDQDNFYHHFRKLLKEKTRQDSQIRLVSSKGQVYHFQVESMIEKVSIEEILVRSTFTDVTTLKEYENKTKVGERRLRDILERTPVGLCITDERGKFLYVNNAYCNIYRYRPADLLGKSFTLVVLDEHKKAMTQLHADFIEGKEELRGEWQVVDSQGKKLFILADAVRIKDEEGKFQKVTFVQDITLLKEIQRELERSNRELQDFAINLSHELKQPLSSMKTAGYLLKEYWKGGSLMEPSELLDVLEGTVERIEVFSDVLLNYSILSKENYPMIEVVLDDLIRSVADQLKDLAANEALDIQFSSLPVVIGHPDLLRQVFENLLVNMIKYKRPAKPLKIKIWSEGTPQKVRLYFKDNAQGMTPEVVERVFDLFFRAPQAEGDQVKGHGVGLAFCKKIVELHQGSIWVESKPKKGSIFIIELPLSTASAKE